MRKLMRFSGLLAYGLIIASATIIVGYTLKARYVHSVWIRNQSRRMAQVSCGWRWSNVQPGSKQDCSFGGIGKNVNCVIKLPNRSEKCSVMVASFGEMSITIKTDESVVCEQLYVE